MECWKEEKKRHLECRSMVATRQVVRATMISIVLVNRLATKEETPAFPSLLFIHAPAPALSLSPVVHILFIEPNSCLKPRINFEKGDGKGRAQPERTSPHHDKSQTTETTPRYFSEPLAEACETIRSHLTC